MEAGIRWKTEIYLSPTGKCSQVQKDMKEKLGDQFESVKVTFSL